MRKAEIVIMNGQICKKTQMLRVLNAFNEMLFHVKSEHGYSILLIELILVKDFPVRFVDGRPRHDDGGRFDIINFF